MQRNQLRTMEAFLLGFLSLAPIYIIQVVPPPESLQGGSGDLLLIPWALLIMASVAGIGYRRSIPVHNLLFGSFIGVLSGYAVFSLLAGWSYIMFFIVPITLVPFVIGAGISYWLNR